MIESDVKEIVIRYYGENFMRSLDANDIMMRAIRHFPKLERLVFETMTDERDQAALMDRGTECCSEVGDGPALSDRSKRG
ncbi:MAG TPA: hypothetical protein VFW23_13630 [Tepidisphaeraceae bacterium]|nr:hypothetical protein [Tepidisphaeraceae bacterium]